MRLPAGLSGDDMKITTDNGTTTLVLDENEARLLRVALERATFVDTRPEDQENEQNPGRA